MVSLVFFIHLILPAAPWLEVESDSNRNEYQGKGGRCLVLRNFKCQMSGKCGSLNFLEPQGPVQASIWIVLPFYIYLPIRKKAHVFVVYLHSLN
jgi:hypothetical protein